MATVKGPSGKTISIPDPPQHQFNIITKNPFAGMGKPSSFGFGVLATPLHQPKAPGQWPKIPNLDYSKDVVKHMPGAKSGVFPYSGKQMTLFDFLRKLFPPPTQILFEQEKKPGPFGYWIIMSLKFEDHIVARCRFQSWVKGDPESQEQDTTEKIMFWALQVEQDWLAHEFPGTKESPYWLNYPDNG